MSCTMSKEGLLAPLLFLSSNLKVMKCWLAPLIENVIYVQKLDSWGNNRVRWGGIGYGC